MEPTDREQQLAAIELARWQGKMDERIKAGDQRYDRIEAQTKEILESQGELAVEVAQIKTKVALYGALGGLAGSAVVTLIVVIATKAFG